MAQNRPFHIAISFGHHNTDGGDVLEKQQTPILGRAVADACKARGMAVRIVQDEVGIDPPMGLQEIAQRVVDWDKAGWPVDIYLETHTEGAGGQRGAFAIYPDTGSDVDNDARRVGQDAARRIAIAAGIPLRGSGIMSERETGVGAQGYRLGIFLRTVPINGHCTRMIIEFGAHDVQADYDAIMGNVAKVGSAVADAFAVEAARLGFDVQAAFQSVTESQTFKETGFSVSHGFLAYFQKYGGVAVFGYPITAEMQENGRTVQYFERARLEWHPDNGNAVDFNVERGLIGTELRSAQERVRSLETAAKGTVDSQAVDGIREHAAAILGLLPTG